MSNRSYFTPLTVVAVILAVVVGVLYFSEEEGTSDQRGMGAASIIGAPARVMEFRDVIEGLGTAQARESVDIMARVSQTVSSIHFSDGDDVEEGQLLVSLSDREERARVQELEFRLAENRRQLSRLRELAQENAASRSMIDEQEVRVEQTSAELEVARSRLAEMTIHAPFSGKLGLRKVSQGQLVRSGDVITTLDAITPIFVDFSVPELYLPSLNAGQRVIAISAAYPDREFIGEIVSLASRVDPVTRSILVRASIDNEGRELRSGMLLRIQLERRVDHTLMVPESAVIPIRNEQFVYVVNDESRAVRTLVETGRRQPGWIEILGGIEEGDMIIVEGTIRVRDGLPVNVTER
ncbi:efflux RND transporter periplasmic adaptor subunit [Aliidiomarina halalkaliphila]|uniref:Efflux RND transporter periplasmic adaptor subunit n=1 Tax=Aliidiomarina halalkaliphila TaxID=2593535 RepID=A0A552X0P0_9GAMM|nr:efflux RND transporter periplasmic adaptor subunit [Aliidiomarina halalkaliphila]TRW48506.1 efflux RND transporter periplasmic adaptor subunit [Aliidiomarina halalkaliphila]